MHVDERIWPRYLACYPHSEARKREEAADELSAGYLDSAKPVDRPIDRVTGRSRDRKRKGEPAQNMARGRDAVFVARVCALQIPAG